MKVSVLEFRLNEDIFCFDAKHIAYVFELEDFTPIQTHNKAVLGVVHYNKDVMLLVDTLYLYSQQSMAKEGEKSVVVIYDDEKNIYGMLVDEILKIEELDKVPATVEIKTEELVINHYKDKEEIVNEIAPLPLLHKYNIAAMKQEQNIKAIKSDEYVAKKEYLLFCIAQHTYAVASEYVKEVVESSDSMFELRLGKEGEIQGAVAVRDEVISVAKLLDEKSAYDSLVIMSVAGKKVAIGVDEVFDIETFFVSNLEVLKDKNTPIDAFYNYNKRVVGIINPHYFIQNIEKKQAHGELLDDKISYREYLTFSLSDKKFTIDMRSVGQVVETEMLSRTDSSSIIANKDIKFITTWNKAAVSVADISGLLGIDDFDLEGSQTIFIHYKDKHCAFLVDEVEDIIYVHDHEVKETLQKESIVGGAVLSQESLFVKINEEFLITMC
jgi:chemotaxis signal transduction protein